MSDLNQGPILEALRDGQTHSDVHDMGASQKCLYLAAFIVIHHSEAADEGITTDQLHQLINERFGLNDKAALKSFKDALRKTGLMSADKRGSHCRYKVVEDNAQLNELLQQYRDHVVQDAAVPPVDDRILSKEEVLERLGTQAGPDVVHLMTGQRHILVLLKGAEAERGTDPDADESATGMSVAHLQHKVADYEADEICDRMEQDPTVIRLIIEALQVRLHRMRNQ